MNRHSFIKLLLNRLLTKRSRTAGKYSSNQKYAVLFPLAFAGLLIWSSCEKVIDLAVKPNKPLLVVEAYINNEIPSYNYVVLSRSQDYFSPAFQSIAVSDAIVSITEGSRLPNNTYLWDTANKVTLRETSNPALPENFKTGVYFDPRLFVNPSQSLKGNIGKFYLLQIESAGKKYSAVTGLFPPVKIDSLTAGYPYVDDSSVTAYRLTDHYKDPDTLGNALFYFIRFSDNKKNFGWGGLRKSRVPGTDDLSNGEYIHLTLPQGYYSTDTINFYMASVSRDVYQFWDSFNKARDNNGPFSTPVVLVSNMQGDDVTGCFSGFSISAKTFVIP